MDYTSYTNAELLAELESLVRDSESSADWGSGAPDAWDIQDCREEIYSRMRGSGATAVMFRYWHSDIIALFPNLPGGSNLADTDTVLSYQHVGQHGGASFSGVMSNSRPAAPHEYAALQDELENTGYNLAIYKYRPKIQWETLEG